MSWWQALFKGDRAIRIAIEGIKRLIEHDKAHEKNGVAAARSVSSPGTPDIEGASSRKKLRTS